MRCIKLGTGHNVVHGTKHPDRVYMRLNLRGARKERIYGGRGDDNL